tara:strand:- start:7083 stop:7877 length:795 start_codon:yes stop_codon:yes gene_type:complete
MNSLIYKGIVIHQRFRPKTHRLVYNLFSLLLDLDELPMLDKKLWCFNFNRPGIISFRNRDHGPLDDKPLRSWVEKRLEEAGIRENIDKIELLCHPRMFGYVFNPLSLYFCYDKGKNLFAVMYEVCNTYYERHTYILPVSKRDQRIINQTCPKNHYVSPFIDMAGYYNFRVAPPDKTVTVAIRHENMGELLLSAFYKASAVDLTNLTLLRCLLISPFQSFKIIFAIHFEAAKMWLKGFPTFKHTPAQKKSTTSIHTAGPKRGNSP